MSITIRDWAPAIGVLCAAVPTLKTPSDDDIANSWRLLHPAAKIGFTPQSLDFAVRQRLLDLEAPRDLALHVALLRYVFPVCRIVRHERGRDVNQDEAILARGPRHDLAERMAEPDTFHDPGPTRPEQQRAPRLPEGSIGSAPTTASAHREHLQGVAAAMRRLKARGHAEGPVETTDRDLYLVISSEWERIHPGDLTKKELAIGLRLFCSCLHGLTSLELCPWAQAWVLANASKADELLDEAQKAPPAAASAQKLAAGMTAAACQGMAP